MILKDDNWAKFDSENAIAFEKHLCKAFETRVTRRKSVTGKKDNFSESIPLQKNQTMSRITLREVKNILNNTETKESSVYEDIKIIKELQGKLQNWIP